jgi:hypothetical protein
MTKDMQSEEEATDVLAAEEFVVPAPDPALRPENLSLPPDPISEEEPHDVLAAEEFAMPAPDEAHVSPPAAVGKRPLLLRLIAIPVTALLAAGVWLWRRGRRQRKAD